MEPIPIHFGLLAFAPKKLTAVTKKRDEMSFPVIMKPADLLEKPNSVSKAWRLTSVIPDTVIAVIVNERTSS